MDDDPILAKNRIRGSLTQTSFVSPRAGPNFTRSGLVYWLYDIYGTSNTKNMKTKKKDFKIIYDIYAIEFLKSPFARGIEPRIRFFGQHRILTPAF